MSSHSRQRAHSSHRSDWPPEIPLSDHSVEEIQRDFPPGSEYQQRHGPFVETTYERRRGPSSLSSHSPARRDAFRRDYYYEFESYPARRSRSRPPSPEYRQKPRRRSYGDDETHRSRRRPCDRDYRRRDRSSDSYYSRQDSPSKKEQGPSLKNLASAGILAVAGKTAYDFYRSRSRDRSADSRGSSPDRRNSRYPVKSRARSVSNYRRGSTRSASEDYYYHSDSDDTVRDYSRRARSNSVPYNEYHDDEDTSHSGYGSDSSSSSGSSTDEERTRKKLRRKELITAGLATVATIHAGHELYESHEKRKERLKKLKEGKISSEEARKERLVGNLKDAASLSLAALGIKKTIDEWKETAKHHSEYKGYRKKCELKSQKRRQRRSSSMDPGW